MGVTIHFKGQLPNEASYQRLMEDARLFARTHHFAETPIKEEGKRLSRVTDDEKGWDYISDVKGIRIDLHPDSEPLFLEFDSDLHVQEWIKTQFAGAGIHALVVGFLRRVKPLFLNLTVTDESEFWENNDLQLLRESLDRCQLAIEDYAAQHPGCRYKVTTPDGRIIDLIT
jgi:hypothetical protein